LQSLDAVRLHTRGKPFNLRNVMQRIAPLVEQEALIFQEPSGQSCYGQIEKRQSKTYAQMCYLGCQDEVDPIYLTKVLEALVKKAGGWKSYGVLADLPEKSPLFDSFRKAGFCIWARQKVYLLDSGKEGKKGAAQGWRVWNSQDINAMTDIYKAVVPAATQMLEPLTRKSALGLVAYRGDGQLAAFTDLEYGPKGVWAQLVTDPQAELESLISTLPRSIPDLLGRPVYLCVRSYQPWLEDLVERLGFQEKGSYILLVKHLVLRTKLEQSALQKIFETGNVEGSLPITQIKHTFKLK